MSQVNEEVVPVTIDLATETASITSTLDLTVLSTSSTRTSTRTPSVSTPTLAPSETISSDQPASSAASATEPQSSTHTPNSTQLSIGAIVGISIGSIVAAIILAVCLFVFLGFRIQRSKRRRRRGTPTEVPEPRGQFPASTTTPGGPRGKAELPYEEYTRRMERLHEGAKPELEGSKARRSVWGFLSIRSASRSEPRQVPTELWTEPPDPGPHELPGDDVLRSDREEPRDARDGT
ncbi:hypothetical protein KVR01_012038 [Diaporthe batatas]|uniref:uncharacterized protein n=1 Tax=Diaporthe batatas TaxID=748121 RepID=UPI001D03D067|nr:uncharacterized protein KVR01_012038 [Diaporthe batatas]KAG8158277.1 hypothetical protein KVR01_012038 [Diaporthe batatas]